MEYITFDQLIESGKASKQQKQLLKVCFFVLSIDYPYKKLRKLLYHNKLLKKHLILYLNISQGLKI